MAGATAVASEGMPFGHNILFLSAKKTTTAKETTGQGWPFGPVRCRNNWDRWEPDLKEDVAHLVDDLRRRSFDAASAAVRWSFA